MKANKMKKEKVFYVLLDQVYSLSSLQECYFYLYNNMFPFPKSKCWQVLEKNGKRIQVF